MFSPPNHVKSLPCWIIVTNAFVTNIVDLVILEILEICGQQFLMCFQVMIPFGWSDMQASNAGLESMCYRDGNRILMMT
jgi:hypothetical protein